MKRHLLAPLFLFLPFTVGHTTSFDLDWSFHRGDCAPAMGFDINPSRLPNETNYTCVMPDYNSSHWRVLDVPHDWSLEDLPPREEDSEFPVLGVRYGDWKLKAGDDPAYAQKSYDDDAWKQAVGGADWRQYGPEFCVVNATGWYRQHIKVPESFRNASGPLLLSIGIVAGAATSYLNGQAPTQP